MIRKDNLTSLSIIAIIAGLLTITAASLMSYRPVVQSYPATSDIDNVMMYAQPVEYLEFPEMQINIPVVTDEHLNIQ